MIDISYFVELAMTSMSPYLRSSSVYVSMNVFLPIYIQAIASKPHAVAQRCPQVYETTLETEIVGLSPRTPLPIWPLRDTLGIKPKCKEIND